jgi:polyisoprenoid-binding protein YceI
MSTATHSLGPDTAKLIVRTGKKGAASKAGHNLTMEVGSWSATVETGESPSDTNLTVSADSRSFKVLEGTGGVKPLGDDDKANIEQTIDDEVLKGGTISFKSTSVAPAPDGTLFVKGELDLLGTTAPIDFRLTLSDDGTVAAEATVDQRAWGIKPYSALFGALKVADEVTVSVSGRLPSG